MRRSWLVRLLVLSGVVGAAAFYEGRLPTERLLEVRLRATQRSELRGVRVHCDWPDGVTSGASWYPPFPSRLEHRFRATEGAAQCAVRLSSTDSEAESLRRIELSTNTVVLPL